MCLFLKEIHIFLDSSERRASPWLVFPLRAKINQPNISSFGNPNLASVYIKFWPNDVNLCYPEVLCNRVFLFLSRQDTAHPATQFACVGWLVQVRSTSGYCKHLFLKIYLQKEMVTNVIICPSVGLYVCTFKLKSNITRMFMNSSLLFVSVTHVRSIDDNKIMQKV